jgi:predicted MFS family arabinose efflux permease
VVCVFLICISLNVVLPALPLLVENLTNRTDEAGLVTGAMCAGAVALELQTSRLLRRWRANRVLFAGFLCATLAMIGFAVANSLLALVVLGLLFGFGFGIIVAATSAMVAELTPNGKRGQAFGIYGMAATLPLIFSPALGLLLASRFGLRSVFWVFAASCILGLVASSQTGDATYRSEQNVRLQGVILDRRLVLLFAALAGFSFTYGGVASFTAFVAPGQGLSSAAAFFFTAGLCRVVSRSASGPLLDRVNERWLTFPSLIAGATGLVLLTFGGVPWVVLAGALYGGGYGIAQTTSLFAMLHRVPLAAAALISGWWNFAVDGGIGIGALVLAPVAAFAGYRSMFLILAGVLVGVVALRTLEASIGARGGGISSGKALDIK